MPTRSRLDLKRLLSTVVTDDVGTSIDQPDSAQGPEQPKPPSGTFASAPVPTQTEISRLLARDLRLGVQLLFRNAHSIPQRIRRRGAEECGLQTTALCAFQSAALLLAFYGALAGTPQYSFVFVLLA